MKKFNVDFMFLSYTGIRREISTSICDPYWKNVPKCMDNFFPSDLLIKTWHYRLPFIWRII